MQEKNVPKALKLQIRTKGVFFPRLGIANNFSDDASIKRCVFVNKVRRLFEGGALKLRPNRLFFQLKGLSHIIPI
jgi:hypothetical protein